MKILALYPYLDPNIDSIAESMLWLGAKRNEILIIAARTANGLKGNLTFDPESRFPGVTVIRPYMTVHEQTYHFRGRYASVLKRINGFLPDVIFCSSFGNFAFSRAIQKDLNLPIVVNTEKLRGTLHILPIRGLSYIAKMGGSPILSFLSKKYVRYVLNRIEALLFSYYGDVEYSKTLNMGRIPVHYVPWCNEAPLINGIEKNSHHGIYIGSINDTKNSAELVAAIPVLLEKTSTKKFTVIGPGPYSEKMMALTKRYPGRMEYITNVPLAEAQRRIAESGYVFTPVIDMGWGLVGDCWALKTALVATHPMQGYINDGIDSLIANGLNDLPLVVERLLTEPSIREKIEQNGYVRYQSKQSAKAVGSKYFEILLQSIDSWNQKCT